MERLEAKRIKEGGMPTAACGIDCEVCKLYIAGICSSCGPGKSLEAMKKIEAQKRIIGRPCPVLECAQLNQIQYCLRDCRLFPCDNFSTGPYPFSQGFLNMQQRRRQEPPPDRSPSGDIIKTPPEFWDNLKAADAQEVCKRTLARPHPERGYLIKTFNRDLLVDLDDRSVSRFEDDVWRPTDYPLLEIVLLVYLLNAAPVMPDGRMIGVKELKDAQFFQGPHDLKTVKFMDRFGEDITGFKIAAEALGGEVLDLADAAYRLTPLPKIPVYYLLWEGDADFKPNLSILFDGTVERHLSADGIWGLVNLVNNALLLGF